MENPCASILKGLGEIGHGTAKDDASVERSIRGAKRIRECFDYLDANRDLAFHGTYSVEAFLHIFREFRLDRKDEHFRQMADRLLDTKIEDPFYEKGISKVGRILEEQGHGGTGTIRAAALVHADTRSQSLVKAEIRHSVEVFSRVSGYGELADFAYERRGKWVYRKGALFPDFFDLKLLAFSDSWKTEENVRELRKAIAALMRLDPLPYIYLEHKGQLIAPGSYLMRDFNTAYSECDDDKEAAWLKRNEWISRMGFIDELPRVAAELDGNEEGILRRKIPKRTYFMKWGSYSGVALEDDWRTDARRMNDIAFRLLLIKHYRGKSASGVM